MPPMLAPAPWLTPNLAASVPPPSLQPRGPLASPPPVAAVPHGHGSVRARTHQHDAASASAPAAAGSLQLLSQAAGSSATVHPVLTQSRQPLAAGPRSTGAVAVNPTPSGQGQPVVKPPHPVPTGSSTCTVDSRNPVGTLTESVAPTSTGNGGTPQVPSSQCTPLGGLRAQAGMVTGAQGLMGFMTPRTPRRPLLEAAGGKLCSGMDAASPSQCSGCGPVEHGGASGKASASQRQVHPLLSSALRRSMPLGRSVGCSAAQAGHSGCHSGGSSPRSCFQSRGRPWGSPPPTAPMTRTSPSAPGSLRCVVPTAGGSATASSRAMTAGESAIASGRPVSPSRRTFDTPALQGRGTSPTRPASFQIMGGLVSSPAETPASGCRMQSPLRTGDAAQSLQLAVGMCSPQSVLNTSHGRRRSLSPMTQRLHAGGSFELNNSIKPPVQEPGARSARCRTASPLRRPAGHGEVPDGVLSPCRPVTVHVAQSVAVPTGSSAKEQDVVIPVSTGNLRRMRSPQRLSSAPQQSGTSCSTSVEVQSPMRSSVSLTHINGFKDQAASLHGAPSPGLKNRTSFGPSSGASVEVSTIVRPFSPRGQGLPPPPVPPKAAANLGASQQASAAYRQNSPLRISSAPQHQSHVPCLRSGSTHTSDSSGGQFLPRTISPQQGTRGGVLPAAGVPDAALEAIGAGGSVKFTASRTATSPGRAVGSPRQGVTTLVSLWEPSPTSSSSLAKVSAQGVHQSGALEASLAQVTHAVQRSHSPVSARSCSPTSGTRGVGMLGCASLGRLGLGESICANSGQPMFPSPRGPSIDSGHTSVPHPTTTKKVDQDQAGGLSLPPFFYEADPTDAMDVALLQELVALNLEVSARLNIKRLRPGEYEIEGVRVSLYWQTAELYVRARRPCRKRGRRGRRRSVSDDEEEGNFETPLTLYLRELANVDSKQVALMDPEVDSAVAAAAFAGATARGVGPSRGRCSPAAGAFSHPSQPNPAWMTCPSQRMGQTGPGPQRQGRHK